MRMLLAEQAVGAVPCESLSIETHGCCSASATSGSDIPNTATSVNASSSIRMSNSVSIGSFPRPWRSAASVLPWSGSRRWILHDAIRMASGPGISCHSLSHAACRRQHVFAGCARASLGPSAARSASRRRRRAPRAG